ncbi:hypothetical protein GIB67_040075 [Kingdonia uniflora]|uniref:RING-type domain-containing protein n=1 Tax=Kingdonia uniflora TaxID=39325 RepID=A0A7J7MUF3_9MAGN|nr:hypothetical protein GIB67_040075 [Kingdonia uniflora]
MSITTTPRFSETRRAELKSQLEFHINRLIFYAEQQEKYPLEYEYYLKEYQGYYQNHYWVLLRESRKLDILLYVSSEIGNGNGDTCTICLKKMKTEDETSSLKECSHIYHVDCISTWLMRKPTCPMCRSNAFTSGKDSSNRSKQASE